MKSLLQQATKAFIENNNRCISNYIDEKLLDVKTFVIYNDSIVKVYNYEQMFNNRIKIIEHLYSISIKKDIIRDESKTMQVQNLINMFEAYDTMSKLNEDDYETILKISNDFVKYCKFIESI